MQVQVALTDGGLDMCHHVLDIACCEDELVAGRALAKQVGYEEGRVDALVPGPAASDYKLA